MNELSFFGIHISSWLIVPLVFLVWVTGLSVIKKCVFKTIQKFAERTKTQWDDIFVQSADFPLTLLIFVSGGAITEQLLPVMADGKLTNVFVIGFKATAIVAAVLFVDRFINGLINAYSHKIEILRSSGTIAKGFVRSLVIGLGFLILLDSFGVSITPILASLGIGSLAVALALQPTLENFFAGIQLVIDKPIQIGQFIKLETGEEGYVHKIGWRSTWVRLPQNNTVVIPNKLLVNARIINYYYPDPETAIAVEVGVHYNSDLEYVEKVTLEVAKETLKEVQGGAKNFEPVIRYHTFADFSVNFSVGLRVNEFACSSLVKHEFIKRLHKRYAQEGIVIPYPIEAVNYAQEKTFEKENYRG